MIVSSLALSQSTNPYVYDEPEMEVMDDGDNPAGPGDPVPIDQYIPLLLIVAGALTLVCTKNTGITKTN